MALPTTDLVALLRALIDIESVSRHETRIATAIESTLAGCPWLSVSRVGDNVIARTQLGRPQRVIVAGHLDTVPVANNLPSKLLPAVGSELVWGRGAVDMKGGLAVMTQLATAMSAPSRDITWVFYAGEEIEASANGLGRLAREHPEWLQGEFAVLMEPTSARIEGGCQGTMRFELTTHGRAAHSARSWLGHNAIHDMAELLGVVVGYQPRTVDVDGLVYREGLNATLINGGVAGNVIADRCTVQINYRFAPDQSGAQAEAQMRELLTRPGVDFVVKDLSPGARPGLDRAVAQQFCASVGGEPGPKYGWTDVARFAELGVPAVNYGPGDPGQAHADDEACPVTDLYVCAHALTRWLT